jgi:pre-mRNA-splicing factor ATP-dependent RNA helicase DHX16
MDRSELVSLQASAAAQVSAVLRARCVDCPLPPSLPSTDLSLCTVETSRQYLRQCMEFKSEWLLEVAKHVYTQADIDGKQGPAGRKMPKGQGAAAVAK